MRRILLWAATCAIGPACGSSSSHDAEEEQRRAAAPADDDAQPLRLVVLVVVDQLPTWTFSRDVDLADGGIARLVKDGVYFENAELPYAITYTAPGHAALGTGAPPAVTHILANSWYRRDTGEVISAIADPGSPVLRIVGGADAADDTEPVGVSGAQLAVDGLADVLRREVPGGRSISIALKDRAAIFALGREPDVAVWYDDEQPAMTTSRYYADEPPAWLHHLSEDSPIDRHLDHVWTPRDPALLARVTGIPDDAPGESSGHGFDNAFPHDVATADEPPSAVRLTPMGDEIVLETALAALDAEELGRDDDVDLLAVSFSAHDYAGHYWGQESWERLDLFLRLDDVLGRLLDALDERVGAGRYAVVLSSDHGATRMIEHQHGNDHRRVPATEVVRAANAAAGTVLGKGEWIATAAGSALFMNDAFHRAPPAKQSAALDAIVAAVAEIDGIDYVSRSDAVAGACHDKGGMDLLACHSLAPDVCGEVFYTAEAGCLLTSHGSGTSHGGPSTDDRRVPIVVYAPGVRPRRVTEVVSVLQVAPTIAELAGLPRLPAAADEPLDLR